MAEAGTQMTVVDWSGRRMLTVREPAGVGGRAWGLLKRIAGVEGFRGVAARFAEPRLLASRVVEVLARMFGGAEGRLWEFLADAPEGEILALRTSAKPEEVSPPLTWRARRPGLFAARTGSRRQVFRPGGSSRETGWLAPKSLGSARLRSEVPMGTASSHGAGPGRGSRDVSSQEGVQVGSLPPMEPRALLAAFSRHHPRREVPRARGEWGDPRTVFSETETTIFYQAPQPAGVSGLSPESPDIVLLSFPRYRTTERESQAVYPVRASPRSARVGLDTPTPKSRRGSQRASARETARPEGTGTPPVAQATFTPRRAGVEAPWFAPPAPSTPLYGRSPGSAAMGPAWPEVTGPSTWTSGPAISTLPIGPMRPMAPAPAAAFPGPVLITIPQGDGGRPDAVRFAIRTVGENLSRFVAVSGATTGISVTRAYRDVAWTGEPAFLDLQGRPAMAGSPDEGGHPASFPRSPAGGTAATLVTRTARVFEKPETRSPATGQPRVYPERLVSRVKQAGSGDAVGRPGASTETTAVPGWLWTEPVGGVQIATFVPRRPRVMPDVPFGDLAADEVLAALGMKGPEMVGSLAGGVAARAGRVTGGSPLIQTQAVLAGVEGGEFAPWAFADAVERAFIAFPGPTRYGTWSGPPRVSLPRGRDPTFADSVTLPTGTARRGAETSRSQRLGDRIRASAASNRPVSALTPESPPPGDRPHPVEPGPYGTTLLARWMSGHFGAPRTAQARAGYSVLAGGVEAAGWRLQGLLRLGFGDTGARPATPDLPRSDSARTRAAATSFHRAFLQPVPHRAPRLETRYRDPRHEPFERADSTRGFPSTPTAVEVVAPLARYERYGESPVSRAMVSGMRGAMDTRQGTSWSAYPAVAFDSETRTSFGIASEVEGVFLRLPWTERLEDADGAIAPTVTRAALGRPKSRGAASVIPGPAFASSLRLFQKTQSPTARPRAATFGSRERHGEIPLTQTLAGWALAGSGPSPRRVVRDGPTWPIEDAPTLLIMSRPPAQVRAGTSEGSVLREGASAIPASAMWFIERTLGRALRALPPEAWGKTVPSGTAVSGLVPVDLAGLLGIIPARAKERRAGATEGEGRWERSVERSVGDFIVPAGHETTREGESTQAVRPERVGGRPPGLPEEPVTLALSVGGAGPAGPVVGPGTVPSLSGLVRSGEVPGPALRGLPLVAPAVSVVATKAMLSRRSEAAPPARTPSGQAPAAAPQTTQPIDLDILAMEMAERILRRMKRDKERRGHHD